MFPCLMVKHLMGNLLNNKYHTKTNIIMKKNIICTLNIFALVINSFSQNIECVSCKANTVSFDKIASAIGEKNTSTGFSSFAGGFNSQATGDYSIGFGYISLSTGLHSVAFGSESKATQTYSVAIGRHAYSTNVNAIAIGKYAEANGPSSFSLGTNLLNSAGFSVLIGNGVGFSTKLVNTTDNSLIIGFNSTVPTLFVGTSSGSNYSGKVGIGNITTPAAKLHIKADNNEHASLKLEPTGSAYYAQLILGNNGHSIYAKANEDLKFTTQSTKNFVFENGKVVTSGLLISTGYALGKLLQSDVYGNAIWTSPAWTISGSDVYRTTGNVGIGTIPTSNRLEVSGTVQATSFIGNGSGLTNIPGDNLGNHIATQNLQLIGKWLSGDGGNEGVFVKNDGNVGIGTSNPQAKLHVNGSITLLSENTLNQLQILSGIQVPGRRGITLSDDPIGAFNFYIHGYQTDAAFNFKNGLDDSYLMTIKKDGSVGIGTTETSGYKLTVAGKILAQELKIVENVPSSDYVFKEEYNLIPIIELDKFIKEYNHLPDVPSAAEFKENGYEVGEMDDLLLRKVEELTLYIIQQQNEIDELKSIIVENINN